MIQAQALIGTALGNVTLQKVLGQGELGIVFLAQQSPADPQVAVKVLSPAATQTSSQQAAFLERFRKEINGISSLEHQNILPVFDYGKYDGLAYLVMPYISGGTLQRTLEQEGPLRLSKIVNYLDQMAAALDYAHKQGVLHLDLKPDNVLMTADDRLLLTDFGLVKIVTESQISRMRLLMAGTAVGLLNYMAPEQVMGDVVDMRADLYSLGVMLYQMATGQTPFQGTPLQIATQHVQTAPPSPRLLREDLPQAAEQVILQALAKRPLDRHADVRDLASAFRVALTSAGSLSESQSNRIAGTTFTSPLLVPRKRGLFDPVWQKAAQEEEGRAPVMNTTKEADAFTTTGALMIPGDKMGARSTVKLTEPVKVVQVPVAGQPGSYVTGLLPVLPRAEPSKECFCIRIQR